MSDAIGGESVVTEVATFKLPGTFEPDFKRSAEQRADQRNLVLKYELYRPRFTKRFVRITVTGVPEDVRMFIEQTRIETYTIEG